jgi:hypothetical protein
MVMIARHEMPMDRAERAHVFNRSAERLLGHLLLFKDGRRTGVECKRVDAPRLTPSMRIALEDLALDHLVVIYPGARAYPLSERVTVLPLAHLTAGGAAMLTPAIG